MLFIQILYKNLVYGMSRDIVISEFGAYCEYSYNDDKVSILRIFAKNLHTAYKIFYNDVEAEIIDLGDYYKVILYCKYALKKEWIHKIEIVDGYLLSSYWMYDL